MVAVFLDLSQLLHQVHFLLTGLEVFLLDVVLYQQEGVHSPLESFPPLALDSRQLLKYRTLALLIQLIFWRE